MQDSDSLTFVAENSISAYRSTGTTVHHGGIGLENIKKRLDLLYGEKHMLLIDSTDNKFRVTLKIPAIKPDMK